MTKFSVNDRTATFNNWCQFVFTINCQNMCSHSLTHQNNVFQTTTGQVLVKSKIVESDGRDVFFAVGLAIKTCACSALISTILERMMTLCASLARLTFKRKKQKARKIVLSRWFIPYDCFCLPLWKNKTAVKLKLCKKWRTG